MFETLGIEGIPFGNNLVLSGPAGIGKSVFCKSLICESLNKGIGIIYVALDAAPKDIKNEVLERGLKKIEQLGTCTFIDGYSWLLGQENENYCLSNLCNINDLSVLILKAMNETYGYRRIIVFDSISTLFLYNSEADIERFIQNKMARIRQSKSIGLWTVEEGIHAPSFYNSLRHLADGVVEMRFEEEYNLKRFIRIHTLRGLTHRTNWFPFTIRHKGKFEINLAEQSEEIPSYLTP
ncbi:MAG: RAD55 family ATPase [Candidatus Bathyarchaeota archaeon]